LIGDSNPRSAIASGCGNVFGVGEFRCAIENLLPHLGWIPTAKVICLTPEENKIGLAAFSISEWKGKLVKY
jgi:hypothetical protein